MVRLNSLTACLARSTRLGKTPRASMLRLTSSTMTMSRPGATDCSQSHPQRGPAMPPISRRTPIRTHSERGQAEPRVAFVVAAVLKTLDLAPLQAVDLPARGQERCGILRAKVLAAGYLGHGLKRAHSLSAVLGLRARLRTGFADRRIASR